MATSKPRELDGLDAEILLALVEEPDATTVSLAQRLSVSRNTIRRDYKLNDGVLESFQRRITPQALGYGHSIYERLNPPGLR